MTIAHYGFWLLRHIKTWLARDIISYSILLHLKLRDYNLGQIAFAVFQVLFAITQLLCHVSALLQAPVNKHNYYVSTCNICAPAERLL